MKKIVILYLSGGIGNQIFQYAAGLSLASKCSGELILESNLGFLIDHKYKRKFLLNKLFKISPKSTTLIDTLILTGYFLKRKIFRILNLNTNIFLGNFFFVEHDFNFTDNFIFDEKFSRYWVIGYWQKQINFVLPTKLLLDEFKIAEPNNNILIKIGHEMRSEDSVALGIRIFEEVENSNIFISRNHEIQINKLNIAIQQMIDEYPNVKFYIFCTHHSVFLDLLTLPEGSIFITGDNNSYDPIDTLWLISQCRHHIFTESSYYWWGAWLSMPYYYSKNFKQEIYMICDNNYLNVKQPGWKYF